MSNTEKPMSIEEAHEKLNIKDDKAALPAKVKINFFDEEELHGNCTVQILKNSVTGETSVGWWENENQ